MTGVPKKFPEATAEFTFSMYSSRLGGQKHGIKILLAPAQLPLPLGSWPAVKPKSGIRLGSMDTVGITEAEMIATGRARIVEERIFNQHNVALEKLGMKCSYT